MNLSIKVALLFSVLFCGCGIEIPQTSVAVQVDTNQADTEQKEESTNQKVKRLSPLISVDELAKLKDDASVRIIEVGQGMKSYQNGHIPGAVFADWVSDITNPNQSARYNVIELEAAEKLLSRLGIQQDTRVVVYDSLANRISTRMYWTLKYYGHDQVQVLDGGKGCWEASQELSAEVPNVKPTDYKVSTTNEQYSATMEYISEHLNDDDVALIDGRPGPQYTGEKPGIVFHTGTPHKSRGHIPSAINIFWKDNLKEDGTFKSPEALLKLYKDRGIVADKTVVTYCNEGLHAAMPWFVLRELLDYDDVRLYDDSMSEWGNVDKPTETSIDK